MRIERRSHPRGETGTKISLEEASKRASEGRLDPRTRAWSIEKLLEAGYPPSKKDQAAAILEALRRERAYVPDPTDAEFMPSAACQLAGCEGLIFLGEDCDGLLIAFLAAVGSIGIEGAVVGHSYEADGQVSHVLAAVYDGKTWHTCDPSTEEPFGHVSRPTREKWLSVPGGMVLCDGPTCNRNQAPNLVRRGDGDFVGVGAPRGYVGSEETQMAEEKLQIEAYVGPALQAVMLRQVAEATQKLRRSWDEAQNEHYRLQLLADETGKPITDDARWTQEREQFYHDFAEIASTLIRYGDEGQTGRRELAWDTDKQETAILGQAGEPHIAVGSNGALEVTEAGKTSVIRPVMHPGYIIGAAIICYVGAIVIAAIWSDVEKARMKGAQEARIKDIYDDQVARGISPEKAARNAAKFGAAIADATRPSEKEASTLDRVAEVAETGMYTLIALGLLGLGGYAMIRFWPLPSKKVTA